MMLYIIMVFNSLSFAMLLFLVASGLTIIFGLMRIINLAHGSFYLLGGYVGLSVISLTGSFLLAILISGIMVGALGLALQRTLLQRVTGNELGQVLMTYGVLLIVADLALSVWGGLPQTLSRPGWLQGSVQFNNILLPKYRLALIMAGAGVTVVMWFFIEKTTLGAMIRAGVDDPEMVRGIGIDIGKVFLIVFGAGSALTGIAGVLGGAMLGIYPGADFKVLLDAFAVIVIGGVGSLRGALVGSLVIGFINTIATFYFTDLAMFTIFVPMVIMLVVRPEGIFGRA